VFSHQSLYDNLGLHQLAHPLQETKMKIAKLALLAVMALAACKADDVTTKITKDDILAAQSGQTVMVDFTATFSMATELDDQQKQEIKQIQAIAESYVAVDDFSLDKSDYGATITIEGTLPFVSADVGSSAPWYLEISPYTSDLSMIALRNGSDYEALESAINDVSFALAPDRAQPVKFDLKLDGMTMVLVPAGQVEGTPAVMEAFTEVERLKVLVGGGIFDDTGAVIMVGN
jgi:hypothetical protein